MVALFEINFILFCSIFLYVTQKRWLFLGAQRQICNEIAPMRDSGGVTPSRRRHRGLGSLEQKQNPQSWGIFMIFFIENNV